MATVTVPDLAGLINNQSGPVEVTQDLDVDLNASDWCFRDSADADVFCVLEDAVGSNTRVEVGADTDVYLNSAALVQFAQGIVANSTGTPINVGVTPGQIDSAGNLSINAGTDLLFTAGDDVVFTIADNIDFDVEDDFSVTSGRRVTIDNTAGGSFGDIRLFAADNIDIDAPDTINMLAGIDINMEATGDMNVAGGNMNLGADNIVSFETSQVGGYMRFRAFNDDVIFSDVYERQSTWQPTLGLNLSNSIAEWDHFDDKHPNGSIVGAIGAPFPCAVNTLQLDYTIESHLTCMSHNLTVNGGVTLTIDAGGVLLAL